MINWLFKVCIAAIISFVTGLISFFPSLYIAALICSHAKDRPHPVMPTSEVFLAFLMVAIVFCYSFYLMYSRFERVMASLKQFFKQK